MTGGLATWPIRTVKIASDPGYENNHATSRRVACLFHVGRGSVERFVQAVIGPLVVRWDVIQCKGNRPTVTCERLEQFGVVVISHHTDFVCRLQARKRSDGRVTHLRVERVKTTTAIY